MDAPLSEGREQYNVTVTGASGTLQFVADQPALSVPAEQLALLGTGPAVIQVSQAGDWALSKPAQLTITL